MAEQKRGGGAMLPLIIVGATLFAFGAYTSTRPKEPEVNKGFEAAATVPQNPRTIQAPDNPPIPKDAAQRAAEATQTTAPPADVVKAEVADNPPWVANLNEYQIDFRRASLVKMQTLERAGTFTCSPALKGKSETDLAQVQDVTCLTKDGAKIEGKFEEDYNLGNQPPIMSDGEITITIPGTKGLEINKSGDEFNTTITDAE